YNDDDEAQCIENIYPSVGKVSIDNAIIEKADNVYVLPADIGWSDLGTWTSVYENALKDHNANACNTPYFIANHSTSNIIRTGEQKAVVISRLQDFIVVDTDKALLICPREDDQQIKTFVESLKKFEDIKFLLTVYASKD